MTNFKKPFIKYLRKHCHGKGDDEYLDNLEKANNVNLGHYEDLFQRKEFKKPLRMMFSERYLNREIIDSRMNRKLLPIYLKKLKIL